MDNSPEKKADELIEKFKQFAYVPDETHNAKQCTLICVDEILDGVAWWSSTDEMNEPYRKSQKEYWQSVKYHLNKL